MEQKRDFGEGEISEKLRYWRRRVRTEKEREHKRRWRTVKKRQRKRREIT